MEPRNCNAPWCMLPELDKYAHNSFIKCARIRMCAHTNAHAQNEINLSM